MFRLIVIFCFMISVYEAAPIIESIQSMLRSMIPTVGVDVSLGSPDTKPEDNKHPVHVEPEVNPNLYEGDIDLPPEHKMYRGAPIDFAKYPAQRWPNGIVPYSISSNYGPSEVKMIHSAMESIQSMSCVKFIPWDGKTADFLNITQDKEGGCHSYSGKMKGPQVVGLQAPHKKQPLCFLPGIIIHELLHSLGFFHEQSRQDRDEYIKINWENIKQEARHNFEKTKQGKIKPNHPYDYSSVMHYGEFFFTNSSGKPTITVLKPGNKIGQRKGLSKTDCMELNELYKCADKIKYSNNCNLMGI